MPLSWAKSVDFACACRVVSVSLAALRTDDGSPAWAIYWHGGRPTRLTGDDCATFDRELRIAKRRILAELATR